MYRNLYKNEQYWVKKNTGGWIQGKTVSDGTDIKGESYFRRRI